MTQLPLGQIVPAAKPLSTFIQPGREQVAGAARPTGISGISGVNAIQQRGRGNVQGFNSFRDLQQALEPFTREAVKAATSFALLDVQSKIKEGFSEEYSRLQNQSTIGAVQLQNDLEVGAADAAQEISELQKVDPEAAQLLTESNPYRMVGRRRAAAMFAGQQVKSILQGDLIENQGYLSTLRPGSAELTERRSELTRQVATSVGLTGNEPEFIKYTLPKINEAWDSYITTQTGYFNKELEASTQALVVTNVGGQFQNFILNGIELGDGTRMTAGDPNFPAIAGNVLGKSLDRHMAMLNPEQRSRVMKQVQEQLLGMYGDNPIGSMIIGQMRVGNPNLPDDMRPTLAQAAPLTMLENSVAGTELRVKQADLKSKQAEIEFNRNFNAPGGLGQMDLTNPNRPEAVQEALRQLELRGHRNPQGYLRDRLQDGEALRDLATPLDPFAVDQYAEGIKQLPLSSFSGDALQELRSEASKFVKQLPTLDQREEARNIINAQITAKTQELSELRTYITPATRNGTKVFLQNDVVQKLLGKQSATSLLSQLTAGNDVDLNAANVTAEQAQNAVLSYIQQANEAAREALLKLPADADAATREGAALGAVNAFNKSPAFQQIIDGLRPPKPPAKQAPAGPAVYNPTQTSELSDSVIKNYEKAPVLSGAWVVQELRGIQENQPYSDELKRVAQRAGVTPAKYLYEHLRRYYSKFDGEGDFRRVLRERIRKERANKTVSFNQPGLSFDGSRVAIADRDISKPGGWLMNMMVAGYMTPMDRQMLRDYAEQMRRLGTPAAIEELKKMNIRYRNYGMAFPLA